MSGSVSLTLLVHARGVAVSLTASRCLVWRLLSSVAVVWEAYTECCCVRHGRRVLFFEEPGVRVRSCDTGVRVLR